MCPIIIPPAGGRTFDDLQTEALGTDFTAALFPGSRVGEFINDAVHRVARRVHLPALETTQTISTVAGTSVYALQTDEIRILSVSNTTDRDPLTEVDIQNIDDWTVQSGKPEAFALSGGALTLYPTPNAVFPVQVRYMKNIVFAAGSDTTNAIGFPDDYCALLILSARARMFEFEDDFQARDQLQARWDVELQNLKTDVHRQSPRRVRQVGDWRYSPTRLPYQVP